MKEHKRVKIVGFFSLLFLTGSIIAGIKPKSILSVNATTESTFLKINNSNNNRYEEQNKVYSTMLEFSVNFASENKSNINIATSSQDLGNKMTLNGVAVKDIPNFFASYYYATDVSKPMIWFTVPEDYIAPSGGYSHTTLFMPKGTSIYDCVTGNDVKIFISDNKWLSTDKWSPTPETIDPYDYSFAIVGDTQDVNYNDKDNYPKIYDWIVANKDSKKIAHTIGLGDITEKDSADEWSRARASFDKLEVAGMRHTQVCGNHETSTSFNNFFSTDEYYKEDIIGYYKTLTNCYRKFRVGSNNYLMVTLEYGAPDDVLAWADGVVESYPNRNVIVITHGYLHRDGTLIAPGGYLEPTPNNGVNIWNKFVKKHANISMVLCGHIYCENVVVSELTGDNGNKVTQVLIDPQQMDRDRSTPPKTGMVAMFYFSNGGKNIQIEYYSTILELYETTSTSKKITVNIKESGEYEEHPAVASTCVTHGHKQYWTHEDKPGVYYKDDKGTEQYSSWDEVELPLTEHTFGKPTYKWDGNKCTATRKCTVNNCGETETETATGDFVKDTDAKCEVNEKGHYEVSFVNPAFTNQSTEANTAENPDTALGHKFTDVVYTWDDDECSAERHCTRDGCDCVETETVTGVYIKDTSATCYSLEKGHYEATFENIFFEKQATEKNSVEKPGTYKSHELSQPTYKWNGDKCIAERHCVYDGCDYVETETATATYIKDTSATCSSPELGHYVASFKKLEFVKQSTAENSVSVGKALGHELVEHKAKEATKTEAGNSLYYECTRCGKFFSDAEGKVEITKNSWVIPAKSGGCGGSIIASSIIVTLVSIMGAGLLLLKRKKLYNL